MSLQDKFQKDLLEDGGLFPGSFRLFLSKGKKLKTSLPYEAGLDALVNMYLRNYNWKIGDDPDSVATTIVRQVSVYPPSRTYQYDRTGYSTLLGLEGRRVGIYNRRARVSSRIRLVYLAAEKRSADWIGKCLEIAREPGRSIHHKLVALHLAGRADHSENTEAIASYLENPSQYVRLMAAYMLLAR